MKGLESLSLRNNKNSLSQVSNFTIGSQIGLRQHETPQYVPKYVSFDHAKFVDHLLSLTK